MCVRLRPCMRACACVRACGHPDLHIACSPARVCSVWVLMCECGCVAVLGRTHADDAADCLHRVGYHRQIAHVRGGRRRRAVIVVCDCAASLICDALSQRTSCTSERSGRTVQGKLDPSERTSPERKNLRDSAQCRALASSSQFLHASSRHAKSLQISYTRSL